MVLSLCSPLGSYLPTSEVQLRRVPFSWEACWFYQVSASFPNDTDTLFIYMYLYKGQSLAIAPMTLSEGKEEEHVRLTEAKGVIEGTCVCLGWRRFRFSF